MNNTNNIFFRRHLPHFQPNDSIYFITFRLHGSLPASVLMRLKEEYEVELRMHDIVFDDTITRSKKEDVQKRYFARFDNFLDAFSERPTYLGVPEIAQVVCNTLHYWDSRRYALVCYCVMPNHVHVVIDVRKYIPEAYRIKQAYALTRIMESIKRFTARKSNELLGRMGKFWQKESYDRVVRDGKELNETLRYIIENPVKAGLVDAWEKWKWTYINFDYFT
jgi:REP element-mobilizing transposase RayT